jgi:dihydroneopterin aldolase
LVSRTRVFLEGLSFRGRHGVLPEERKLGGQFRVDIEMDIERTPRPRDRLSDTVDYRAAWNRARDIVERRRFKTLESLADALADAIMRLPRVRGARVKVTKLAPVLGGEARSAVEVTR